MLDMLCNFLTETKRALGGINLPLDGSSPSKKEKADYVSAPSFYGAAGKKPVPVPETRKVMGSVAPSNSGGGRTG